MSSRFNVGDRVKFIRDDYPAREGDTATVVEIEHPDYGGDLSQLVELDRGGRMWPSDDGVVPLVETVAHPAHYTNHPSGVECITIVQHMNFALGNVVKYVWRADAKGSDIEDLRKARQYLDIEIARREALK